MGITFSSSDGRRPQKEYSSQARWLIRVSKKTFIKFVQSLPQLFKQDCILEVDGISMTSDVIEFFQQFKVIDTVKKTEFSLFRRPMTRTTRLPCAFQMPLTAEIVSKISQFYENHAEPEILDHLYVLNKDGELLLSGFELCGGSGKAHASELVDESKIRKFCQETGCQYKELKLKAGPRTGSSEK